MIAFMETTITELKFQTGPPLQTDQAQGALPVELLSLSIEEVMVRASTTTQVLKKILVQDNRTRYSRHWGINE
jgi:hypothetical protein